MKKNFLDSIDVKSPCSESWDEMKGNDEVRFCSHCAKNVHDISAMTRAKAEKLVKNSNGKLCVRYVKNPNGKVITAPPKLTQIKRRAAIAAGVLATSLTLSALTYAQGEPMQSKGNPNQTQKEKSPKSGQTQISAIISGEVKDENGAVIPGAKITLRDKQTEKIRITQSNDDGFYEFRDVAPAIYDIEVESPGFKKLVMQNVEIAGNLNLNKTLTLDVGETVVGLLSIEADPIVNPSESKPTMDIQFRTIEGLPLNGRTFTTMGLTAFGTNEKDSKNKKPKKKKKKN